MANRRDILLSSCAALAAAAASCLGLGRAKAQAQDAPSPYSHQYFDAMKGIVGEIAPEEAGVSIDLPEVAENGNIVPYKLAVESPMTPEEYVATLYLLSTANPQATVAAFHFTPACGKAAVMGRMRLAKTQDVVAVAVTNGGKFLQAKRNVQVTIGGCGNE